MRAITIQKLHANTAEVIRRAGKSSQPLAITDGGKVLAIPASSTSSRSLPGRRTLLPEYAELLNAASIGDVIADLNMVRSDR